MEPLYAWDSKDNQTLKSLLYAIDWFERAIKIVDGRDGDNYKYNVEEKKLTVIYQFALDMPLLFVPQPDTKLMAEDEWINQSEI